jgi:hypothetical protein
MFAKGLPSWIKTDLKEIPEYMLRGRKGGDDGGEEF